MKTKKSINGKRGWLMIELLAAISVLGLALLPFAYSFTAERKLARSQYQRVLAMELVDGEMEVLAAGAWTNFPTGKSPYKVDARSITNLPVGEFVLNVAEDKMVLEWKPVQKMHGGPVMREVRFK